MDLGKLFSNFNITPFDGQHPAAACDVVYTSESSKPEASDLIS